MHNHVPQSLEVVQVAPRLPPAPSVEAPYQKPFGCVGCLRLNAAHGISDVFEFLYKLVLSSSTVPHEVVTIRSNELLGLMFEK